METDFFKTKCYSRVISLLTLFSVFFLFQGCRVYYDEAMSGGDYSYMHTPIYEEGKDDNAVQSISAKYSKGITYYGNEENQSGEISYYYGESKKHVNYALGFFVFGGEYKVDNLKGSLSDLNDDYSFFGGGIRGKIAFNLPISEDFHWRVFGLQGTWYIERGSFYNFKKELYNIGEFEDANIMEDFIGFSNDITNFSIYPYTEFVIKLGDSWSLTPNAGLGYKMNRVGAFRSFVGLNLSYKNFNIWGVSEYAIVSLNKEIVNDFLSLTGGDNNISQIGISLCF